MCSNYESQLQRVQEQMVADMDEKERSMDRIRVDCEKYKVNEECLLQDALVVGNCLRCTDM